MLLRPFLWGQILSQVVFSPCLKVCASFPLTFLGSLLFLGAAIWGHRSGLPSGKFWVLRSIWRRQLGAIIKTTIL